MDHRTVGTETHAPLATLSTPSYGSVTSLAPSAVINLGAFLNSLNMLAVLTFVVGVALGLSWAAIAYAVSVTVSLCVLDQIPRFAYREPAADAAATEGAGELLSYQPSVLVETES